MKHNVSYVDMYECYMDFMQNLHAFFMDKKLVVITFVHCWLYMTGYTIVRTFQRQ